MVNLHTQVKVIFSHSLVSLLFLYYFCILSGFIFCIILTFIVSYKICHHNFLSYAGQANMKAGEIELSFLDALLLVVLFCKLLFSKTLFKFNVLQYILSIYINWKFLVFDYSRGTV